MLAKPLLMKSCQQKVETLHDIATSFGDQYALVKTERRLQMR